MTSTYHARLELFELGCSIDRIAATWNEPSAHVASILNDLSQHPLPPRIRQAPRLPAIPQEAHRRRETIRQLFRHGWTAERLAETTLYYTPGVIASIVGEARTASPRERQCACGCGQSVFGRQRFATEACRKRYQRKVRAAHSYVL
jgi:hypothetical protein